jgi:hypothetical protein
MMMKVKMISKLTDGADLNQMLKALRSKFFNIDRDSGAGTVIVTHIGSKTEVLRAIQKEGRTWIVSHAGNLFQAPVKPVTAADMFD